MLVPLVLAALVAAPAATPRSPGRAPIAGSVGTAVERAVAESPRPATARAPEPAPGPAPYVQEITVSDWHAPLRLTREERAARPRPYLGPVRGGPANSPSFDAVTQTYWWE